MTKLPPGDRYRYEPQLGVWVHRKETAVRFGYSDGDEEEERLDQIIRAARDLSSLSPELRSKCTDWTTTYHLSPRRANLLRPFLDCLRGEVLEVGAGCGALTRFLGECSGSVVALEPSQRRAAIARARTRDLPNVTVVVDRLETAELGRTFDVIVYVGVLEYASTYSESPNAHEEALARLRQLLSPRGMLLMAIENQVGLKYLAGAPEDHHWTPMYGVEDHYQEHDPRTFGRHALWGLLRSAGFERVEFFAPFPDYKLPTVILTEAGMRADAFNAAALISRAVRDDPQIAVELAFAPERVWPTVIENELGLDLANSFLIAAGARDAEIPDGFLAVAYSTERLPKFAREKVFSRGGAGDLMVNARPVAGSEGEADTHNAGGQSSRYIVGEPLDWRLMRLISRPGWTIDELSSFFSSYFELIGSSATANADPPTHQATCFPPTTIDAIPQNIIVTPEGNGVIIDTEWAFGDRVTRPQLVFRTLLALTHSTTRMGLPQDHTICNNGHLLQALVLALGDEWTPTLVDQLLTCESDFQEHVTGVSAMPALQAWLSLPLRTPRVSSSSVQLQALEDEIRTLRQSTSWRLTAPLRWVMRSANSWLRRHLNR